MPQPILHGGDLVAETLTKHGIPYIFTLCGGHISPIFTAAKARGIRVIDVRHEVNAVFAADAVGRLSAAPGVAAVTAGPGLTNTITAVKNAQLARSPLVLLGGATATVLRGRGSLQDIDQLALLKPHVKWYHQVNRVAEIVPTLYRAFVEARSGVPGPVFVELPVDLLYPETLVRGWYLNSSPGKKSFKHSLMQAYLGYHLSRLFRNGLQANFPDPQKPAPHKPSMPAFNKLRLLIGKSQKPVLLLGSDCVQNQPHKMQALVQAVENLQIPVYLTGSARGLLGRNHPLQLRHHRRKALKESDLIIMAGLACDFRLDYGRQIPAKTTHIGISLSKEDLKLNKKPDIAMHASPSDTIIKLAKVATSNSSDWLRSLRVRDGERQQEIDAGADKKAKLLNPVELCQQFDRFLDKNALLVADGGDFVGTAAYTVQPAGPLSWLDPGLFGTLGVGAGFALGAKLVHPEKEVWIIYGDGSCGYSLMEYDTFVRHNIPVLSLVGNDASWAQIAREQVEILKDDVATVLARNDYHLIAKALGAGGWLIKRKGDIKKTLESARKSAKGRRAKPGLINAHLDKSDFRKGSISM